MVAADVLDPAIEKYVRNSALGPVEVRRSSRFGLKSLTRYERHIFLGVVEWFSHCLSPMFEIKINPRQAGVKGFSKINFVKL